jgi:competence protein ComEC
LIPVLREIPVGEVTYNGVPSLSKFYRQWIAEVRARQLPALTVHAGNEIPASPDLRLRVLNPPRGGLGNRSADNSLVLALEYGPTRVLLMSDAGETVEQRLLAGTDDLRANIVIKGRHGKESSCTEAFLDAVRPEAVVLAVGTRPATRYPQPDLRERLEGRHVATYRTDEAGAVTIRLTKRGYTIRTCLAPQ